MKKFTLGVISGMSGLAIAVPIVAHVALAQTGDSTSSAPINLSAPSQECLLAMVRLHDAQLSNFDAQTVEHKQMLQEKRDAIAEIAAIDDDAARTEALQTMHDAMRAEKAQRPDRPEAITTAMEAVRDACGGMFKMRMGRGHGMFKGHGGFMMKMHKMGMPLEEASSVEPTIQ